MQTFSTKIYFTSCYLPATYVSLIIMPCVSCQVHVTGIDVSSGAKQVAEFGAECIWLLIRLEDPSLFHVNPMAVQMPVSRRSLRLRHHFADATCLNSSCNWPSKRFLSKLFSTAIQLL